MESNDQEKINIAREYFTRADQGRPDILELFQEDAEVYFRKFRFGFGRNSFLEMVKGFEGALEYIQHDYGRFTLIPSADYLVVEGTSQGRMSGQSWAGAKRFAADPLLARYSDISKLEDIAETIAKKAGVEGAELHRFRKTYADTLHEEGVSVNTIRIRLGHESLDVTLAYLKGKDAESEEAQEHANSSSLALYA